MQLDAAIPGAPLDECGRAAAQAEEIGFSAVWSSETNHDPFLPLVLAAQRTARVTLGTSNAVAFPRSPLVLAQLAWDLQSYSKGRFVLGLGTQVKAHNERRFGVPWGEPGPRLREMLQMIHAVWDTWQDGKRPAMRVLRTSAGVGRGPGGARGSPRAGSVGTCASSSASIPFPCCPGIASCWCNWW